MIPIYNNWCIQIDVTNFCGHGCTYCSRYNRHLRNDQRGHMTLDQVRQALDALKDWPAIIGIIGGEPILHPQFREICELIRERFPIGKMGLWTSGGAKYQEYLPIIGQTFGFTAYNEHNDHQKNTCKHQPLTVAINEAVPDTKLRDLLISDCWVQRSWCATVNSAGAYFCEVAAAQDLMLNDGANAWPVTEGWWRKTPEEFQDQVDKLCGNCGMAIPMERELLLTKVEKFTPKLLETFREHGLRKVEDSDVEVFTHEFTKEEIKANLERWFPGNYRGDLVEDERACEGKGFTKELE